MNILKQSTAATIKLGPFVDDTDGKTAETALTIGQADIRLSKNGGDMAQTNNSAGATHDELGYYNVPLDATDTNTLGRLLVAVHESGALPVWQEFLVVTANVYDTLCSTDKLDVAVVEMATDVLTAASVKADAVTKIQNGLATSAALDAVDNFVDTEVAAILAAVDTEVAAIKAKTDNLPDSPANEATLTAIKGAGWTNQTLVSIIDYLATTGVLVDVQESGVALEATLMAIKGAGWTNETLVKIVTDIAAISAGAGATAQEVWEYATRVLTAGTNLPTVAQIAQEVWHKPTIDGMSNGVDSIGYDLLTAADAIKAKTDLIPASPAEAGEYTAAIGAIPTAPLLAANYTAPDNAGIAAVKAKTDNLPANPADDSDIDAQLAAIKSVIDNIHDTDLPAVKAETALIIEDTGTTLPATLATIAGYTDGIAGDVWSHATRTLTNQGVEATYPAEGDPLIIYRDTTVTISLTGLGDSTGDAGTKIFFTAKENLEDADSDSILQLVCTRADPITDPDTDDLLYVNKVAPTAATEGTFVFADHTDGTAVVTVAASAAAYLPIYAATPLYWDVKMVTAAGVSTILATGEMYIYGTPTRTVAVVE